MHFGFWQQGKTDRKFKLRWEREDKRDAVWKTRKIKGAIQYYRKRREWWKSECKRKLQKERSIKHAYSNVTLENGFNRFGPPKGGIEILAIIHVRICINDMINKIKVMIIGMKTTFVFILFDILFSPGKYWCRSVSRWFQAVWSWCQALHLSAWLRQSLNLRWKPWWLYWQLTEAYWFPLPPNR